ncbi:hypothetical protein SAMN02745157_2819 [Kaistia soli DSM 19436]|uniref:Uncharacterized protein n=1 Tax=Kaistia soli DSM 19436 TaxID=1122133 RepID=A0A1M5DWP0_9HYPH|nr:hypothetical protein [Kaistia soli]SHF71346.1 hypothetical protein SAMN02745157_2819 [Kaistia soli DSM 19436]
MSSKSTKAKRKAIHGNSVQELIDAGLIDQFYNLKDSVDTPPLRMTRHLYLPKLPKRAKEAIGPPDNDLLGEKRDDRP